MEWFKVNEEMPVPGERILFTTCGQLMVGYFSADDFYNEKDEACGMISHWMPLPILPSGTLRPIYPKKKTQTFEFWLNVYAPKDLAHTGICYISEEDADKHAYAWKSVSERLGPAEHIVIEREVE